MLVLSMIMHASRHFVVQRGLGTRDEDSEESSTLEEEDDKKKDKSEAWYLLPSNMTRNAWLKVSMGVALVTFSTPALSNYALFQIALALALTLGSVGPLYALPLTWLLQGNRPSLCAWLGGILAVSGVIVLSFLGKQNQ
jgi:drug/metabolite transporter (DMT)-like permease